MNIALFGCVGNSGPHGGAASPHPGGYMRTLLVLNDVACDSLRGSDAVGVSNTEYELKQLGVLGIAERRGMLHKSFSIQIAQSIFVYPDESLRTFLSFVRRILPQILLFTQAIELLPCVVSVDAI